MDVPTHISFFLQGQDPVVWLRVVRIVLFVSCGCLMFIEPMLCGGRNKSFHRLLGVVFFMAGLYNWSIAKARMAILVSDPQSLAQVDLLAFELIYTGTLLVLLGRLLYDWNRWHAYNLVKKQRAKAGACHNQFTP